MTFDEIYSRLISGGFLRRRSWPKNRAMQLQKDRFWITEFNHGTPGGGFNSYGDISADEVLADDWEVYEDQMCKNISIVEGFLLKMAECSSVSMRFEDEIEEAKAGLVQVKKELRL